MNTVYVFQPFPHTFHKSLYLAGPTPRDPTLASWRPQALHLLKASAYDGVVFVPESQDGQRRGDYNQQMAWELEAMRRADILLFWVPAEKDTLPAYTTRIEFGLQVQSGKVVLGMPHDAYKTRYIEKLAQKYQLAVHHTLAETVTAALAKLGRGAERSGAECLVPLEIWHAPHFQEWYRAQTAAGHTLADVPNIEWVFRVGEKHTVPLFIALHVAMKVHGEDRIKANEAVIIRPSIVTVCAYCPGESRALDRFVLIKEYRTSVMNAQGFVFELPGGSSVQPGADPIDVAMDELEQETGSRLARGRFRFVGRRQIAATMIANEALLLAVRLELAEMDAIADRQGETHGNSAEAEHTSLYVFTRQQLIEGQLVDYATLGQIALVDGGRNRGDEFSESSPHDG
jgi:8-oxo-dGTP pyrophosphatase MutT (NUDIX family)/nucleoside 2-deoxyribosyltransferase